MKFINITTPLGIEIAIGTSEPYPTMPVQSPQNLTAAMSLMRRFQKEGPPQWVIGQAIEASMRWLDAEGFEELKDNPNYEWLSVESITGNIKDLSECLPGAPEQPTTLDVLKQLYDKYREHKGGQK